MRIKKLILILALVLPFIMVTATVMAKKPTITADTGLWQLSNLTVVNPGQAVEMKEGLFTTGFTLEANAYDKNGDIVPDGKFQLTLSAFSPFEQMGTQKPGYWYIQGIWTLTKNNPDLEAMQAKHNAETVEGSLVAELPFNPTTNLVNWTGLARLNMSLLGDNWATGEGTLTFNLDNTGSLFLDLTRWPDLKLETSK